MNEATKKTTGLVPTFSPQRCKRCGICAHVCPTGAIAPDDQGVPTLVDPDACTSCRLCEHMCPDFAVSMVPPEEAEREESGDASRDGDEGHPPGAPEVCHPFGACDG